ncbi:phage minor head protein [Chitinophaga sp. Hz27]|uniref:phage minor head protein n=1 Tax=Chitinophaga sp. Hz27 TaxID=3347169 RepID=UPI0035DD2964
MTRREQQRLRRQWNRYQIKTEVAWQKPIYIALRKQVNQFLAFAKDQGVNSALAQIDVIVKEDPVKDVLYRMYKQVIPAYASIVFSEITDRYKGELAQEKLFGISGRWLRDVTEYILNYAANKITSITETTRDNIRTTIERELANGESYARIAQKIDVDPLYAGRARIISRTEVSGSANYAAHAGAEQTGLEMLKIWISELGDRTRRVPRDSFDHLHMNGVTVAMNEPFTVNARSGEENIDFPGDPTGSAGNVICCRCTQGYEAKRDSSGRLIRKPVLR